MDYQDLLKKARRKPLLDMAGLAGQAGFYPLDFGREALKRILPHREPFLLVDRVCGLWRDGEDEVIFGSRYLDPADPVFSGHFPGFPLYPGCLQVEMGGQLGLCLTHFLGQEVPAIAPDAVPAPVRATKLHGALFLAPLAPGREAQLIARKLEYDGYFGTVLTQVLSGGEVCSVAIAEVMFLDQE